MENKPLSRREVLRRQILNDPEAMRILGLLVDKYSFQQIKDAWDHIFGELIPENRFYQSMDKK